MNEKQQSAAADLTAETRNCPVCGHEAWPIAYGMMTADAQARSTKTVFAGCCLKIESRINPQTGLPEMGTAEWGCQNPACGHQWW